MGQFIPVGEKVKLKDNLGQPIVPYDKELILESEVSLGLSSSFEPILSSGGNKLFTILASGISELRERGITGQFKQQGFRVWTETKPLELKLSVGLYMKTSGREDVIEPSKVLLKLPLPKESDQNSYGLIPPGPNIVDVLGEFEGIGNLIQDSSFLASGDGTIQVQIGSYINITGMVVQNAIPTYSKNLDDAGFPIWCKIDLDLITTNIATQTMIDNLSV